MVRILSYVFLLIIVILGFTFALLNSTPVNINFYIGSALMPLSMLLFISFVAGLLLAIFISLIWVLRLKRSVYKLRHQKKQLEHELAEQKIPVIRDDDE